MATQSIMKNIIINEPQAAETFIRAMEKAAAFSEHHNHCHVEYEDIKGEDIKIF